MVDLSWTLVVAGGSLAAWAWVSPDGLPKTAADRMLAERLGVGSTRALDLVLALLVVALGVLAASGG